MEDVVSVPRPARRSARAAAKPVVVKSAARTLAILEHFDRCRASQSVGEIADALQLPQSSTSALLRSMVAVGYLTWSACLFTYESWEFNDIAQGLLPVPMWIPQLSFALGSVLFWVAVVDEFIIVLRGGVPSFVRAVEERHAKGDFSSDI